MRYILKLLIIILLNICILAIVGHSWGVLRQSKELPVLSKIGSRGEEVRQIQQRLKNLGYDVGTVDGIYGNRTAAAVKRFQRDRGLTVDGIAGPNTLRALSIGVAAATGDSDYQILARMISAESRGEPYAGQVAVGAVILNRVRHPSFPDTIAGVLYQPGAFSALKDGQFNQPVAESAYRAAKEALNGSDPSGGAIYYYNPAKTTNAFMVSRPAIKVIGKHKFCR